MKANDCPWPETVDEKLEGAGVAVAQLASKAHGGSEDLATQVIRQTGCRRHLDDLLEVALHAAIALAEVGDRAVDVAEDLHLDVTRLRDELLDVEVTVPKGRLRFRSTAVVRRGDRVGALDHARARRRRQRRP